MHQQKQKTIAEKIYPLPLMYSLLTTLPPLFPYDIVEMSYLRFTYILYTEV